MQTPFPVLPSRINQVRPRGMYISFVVYHTIVDRGSAGSRQTTA